MLRVNSRLKRLFEDKEIEKLRKAVVADDVIIPALEKIINETYKELTKPNGKSSFGTSSWALEKAYQEGGAIHLQQLLDIFKGK